MRIWIKRRIYVEDTNSFIPYLQILEYETVVYEVKFFGWLTLVCGILYALTHIGNISGPSPSVFYRNQIQKIIFRQLWRHTWQLDSDVICGGEGAS